MTYNISYNVSSSVHSRNAREDAARTAERSRNSGYESESRRRREHTNISGRTSKNLSNSCNTKYSKEQQQEFDKYLKEERYWASHHKNTERARSADMRHDKYIAYPTEETISFLLDEDQKSSVEFLNFAKYPIEIQSYSGNPRKDILQEAEKAGWVLATEAKLDKLKASPAFTYLEDQVCFNGRPISKFWETSLLREVGTSLTICRQSDGGIEEYKFNRNKRHVIEVGLFERDPRKRYFSLPDDSLLPERFTSTVPTMQGIRNGVESLIGNEGLPLKASIDRDNLVISLDSAYKEIDDCPIFSTGISGYCLRTIGKQREIMVDEIVRDVANQFNVYQQELSQKILKKHENSI